MTKNNEGSPRIDFLLTFEPIGKRFYAEMKADLLQYSVNYYSDSKAELVEDFKHFQSGFIKYVKYLRILSKGFKITVGDIEYIGLLTLQEARLISGTSDYEIAKCMGISLDYLKRWEDGKAKRSPKYDQGYSHYRSLHLPELPIDAIDWSLEQQKKPLPHSNEEKAH